MGLAEIKLPDELLEELDKIAKKTSKPKSFHLRRAIRAYIEEYRDLEIALERSKNKKKDRLITSEQLKKALGI